jgi:hypothetical protein
VTEPYIRTFSGLRHDLLNPDPDSISILDIAHALSQICRFTGHTGKFYSVAQHSVIVAKRLRDTGHGIGIQRQGILHDAHEAYTGDVASPIKLALECLSPPGAFGAWADFESRHASAVRTRFRLPCELSPAVKQADLVALVTEARDFMIPCPGDWPNVQPMEQKIYEWNPAVARGMFLEECERCGVV